MSKENALASAPPTQAMQQVGLSFIDVIGYAKKSVQLLQEHGDEFIGMIDAGFRAFQAITGRNYPALFDALNDVNRNTRSVIDAIRQTFNIKDDE